MVESSASKAAAASPTAAVVEAAVASFALTLTSTLTGSLTSSLTHDEETRGTKRKGTRPVARISVAIGRCAVAVL